MMGARWIKISVVYFILGIGFGMFMSISKLIEYAPAHAHINLAGWATIAITGLIYHLYPKAGNSTLGKWHFWVYNIGLPILLLAMIFIPAGLPFAVWETLTMIGGTLVTIGIIIFVINVFTNVHDK